MATKNKHKRDCRAGRRGANRDGRRGGSKPPPRPGTNGHAQKQKRLRGKKMTAAARKMKLDALQRSIEAGEKAREDAQGESGR